MKKLLFIGGYNSKGRKADTLEFCNNNNITPIISKGDDHRLGKYFEGLQMKQEVSAE